MRRSIADLHLEITDTIAAGATICFVLHGAGTHDGPLGPLPASGTPLTIDVVDVCRFQDGKIADRMGTME